MVLASKLGSQVSFQPDKNFQQSFASWVKQGQTNNSGKPGENLLDINWLYPVPRMSESKKCHRNVKSHLHAYFVSGLCVSTDVIQPKVLGIFPSGPPANLRTYSTLHPTTGNLNIRATTSASTPQQKVFRLLRFSLHFCCLRLNGKG